MAELLPLSAVIPTRNRVRALSRTLQSLAEQSAQPTEILLIDASDDNDTRAAVEEHGKTVRGGSAILWRKAAEVGAAAQRNAGMALAKQPFILFCDDDVLFEPECLTRLWTAITSDPGLGGVSAMIMNQRYQQPGRISRLIFTMMNGKPAKTFAGKIIGPAVNLLPEDRPDLPETVPVEWLNLGCTIYRRDALPNPPFDPFFAGYSLMEDVTLSLNVAQGGWKLANVRTARIFHDSQPGEHKSNVADRAAMELVNRHYVMTKVLKRRQLSDYFRLVGWEVFQLAAMSSSPSGRKDLLAHMSGRLRGFRTIIRG
jgi:GT2 family glycosyltransferase